MFIVNRAGVWLSAGLQGPLSGAVPPAAVTGPSIQAQLYRLEQHYHLQKEMLSRQFEEDQRLLEHEKQQYKMQVCSFYKPRFHYAKVHDTNHVADFRGLCRGLLRFAFADIVADYPRAL